MSCADAELGWYFGTASKTWQGDAGLRSPGFDGVRTTTNGAIAAQRVEDGMLERCSAANQSRVVEAKLRQLSSIQVDALRLHYSASLPFGIEASAILLTSARGLVTRQSYAAARTALAEVRKAARKGQLAAVHAALGVFLSARNRARGIRRVRLALSLEVLRMALHDASKEERRAIEQQAGEIVRMAKACYDVLEVDRGRSVQVHDPRPWKRES